MSKVRVFRIQGPCSESRGTKKIIRSSQVVQAENCVDYSCTEVYLNASALSDSSALLVPLTSPVISDTTPITALVDCGSTHCFISSDLVNTYRLPCSAIPPIRLKLFDGTSNSVISETLELPITFSTGETMTVTFYVTTLNSSASIVLGHNWLTRYNPLIDWVLGSIKFRSPIQKELTPLSTSAEVAPSPLQTLCTPDDSGPPVPSSPIQVSLVNAAAFVRACKLPGAQAFTMMASDLSDSISARSNSVSDTTSDLANIPEEYHDFADVFSKNKAETLAPHCPYDLKIELEEGTTPPIG
jgi:hypothetical protein